MPLLRRSTPQPQVLVIDTTSVDQDFLAECADFGDHRLADYRLCETFHDGEQRVRLTDRQKAYLEEGGVCWNENFLETIVSVTRERMNVAGFNVEDNEDASDWLTRKAWGRNRMGQAQGVVHTNTMVKGDGFVMVGYNDQTGLPVYTWNRPELHKPVYDEDGALLYDVKKWSTSKVSKQNPSGRLVWRLNLHYPDRIEKYFSLDREGKQWAKFSDDTDTSWPVWWTSTMAPDGEPLGVNVLHFRNQPLGRNFGRSDIKALIPFHNELHKHLLDLFSVMDSQGWPQRHATGVENTAALKTAPGEVWSGPDGATFGQFDAADPKGALSGISATLHRMAAKARVPLHILLMEGQMPSGESQKTANSPLVKKVDDRKTDAGGTWEDLQRMGWKVASAFGAPEVPEFDPGADITCLWDSSEDRNEVSEVTVAGQKQDLGVSRTTTLRELGYDPDEEAKLRREERAADGPPAIGDQLNLDVD